MLLKDIFKKNECPQFFIDKCIKTYLSKLFVPKRIIYTIGKKHILLIFFLCPLSFKITSQLQKCFKNYIPYCSLKVVCQTKSRMFNLLNFKDVVNTRLSSHIFYKFICSCCNANYHGQTQKRFLWELQETPKKSAIFDYILLDGHKDSVYNFSILLKEINEFKLQLK